MLNQIDLSRTDLNLLVLFETVLEKGHVGQAAAALSLSPSAVSHGLGRLRRLLNDPLFLRTPRGVTPTDRALDLAPRIAEILQGVRGVLGAAEPFDPATSTRRFRIGAPIRPLPSMARFSCSRLGPRRPVSAFRCFTFFPGSAPRPARAPSRTSLTSWTTVASISWQFRIWPIRRSRRGFWQGPLAATGWFAVCRPDHPFARAPSLETYCAARHVFMSLTGDMTGVIDTVLARMDRQRVVVTTVPNAMLALLMAASTDLVAGVPSSLAEGRPPASGWSQPRCPLNWTSRRFTRSSPVPPMPMPGLPGCWTW